MKNSTTNFNHKKIGIWGFGVVGKSVYDFLKPHTNQITVLDTKPQHVAGWILQTQESIIPFLEHNDIIIISPGIPVHAYQNYSHKFLCELDIFAQTYQGKSIAITGTLGKTSITKGIAHCIAASVAAGNIGYAMLEAQKHIAKQAPIVLELSSFQLQYQKNYSPDIALWTNFYPNHLDHHQTEDEYFAAKCQLFALQKKDQIALLPCNLIKRIKQTTDLAATIFLTCTDHCARHDYPTFYVRNDRVLLAQPQQLPSTIFSDITDLPEYTYQENWLQILATLHLANIDLTTIDHKLQAMPQQEDRLEKVLTPLQNTTIYNDSKSTVWQATACALKSLGDESCALFLGGISKGTDREPLIDYLQNKAITVFAFGKEATILKNMCDQKQIMCHAFGNLKDAVHACLQRYPLPKHILFSPGGASFDLFKNYHERGQIFKDLIKKELGQ